MKLSVCSLLLARFQHFGHWPATVVQAQAADRKTRGDDDSVEISFEARQALLKARQIEEGRIVPPVQESTEPNAPRPVGTADSLAKRTARNNGPSKNA